MSFLELFFVVCILSYNAAAGKTSFKTRYGDIYDCVDFYKQPTFDLPIFQNHSFHPGMRPSFLTKSKERITQVQITEVNGDECPMGYVPIRRFSKSASKMDSFVVTNEPAETYDAGVRTKPGSTRYGGGGMILSVWNPPFVRPSAYSQARMKVSSGSDAIQVGWRVDPTLRGDNRTRQFVYTDAGQLHCFDAQCGFIIVNTKYPLDQVREPVSQPGKATTVDLYNITRDNTNGNWWLLMGDNFEEIGFWPKDIFTGLRDFATDVEWAGEVYSPPGIEKPVMGSGYKPEVRNSKYVAYFARITVVNDDYSSIDAYNLEEFATDRSLYDVKDEGNVGLGFNHLAWYGGARY